MNTGIVIKSVNSYVGDFPTVTIEISDSEILKLVTIHFNSVDAEMSHESETNKHLDAKRQIQTQMSLASKSVINTKTCSLVSWPENQGILFFYISKTLEMIRISFMASLLNAVL